MAHIQPLQFNKLIKDKDFKTAYIIAGEETFLIEEALQSFETAINADHLNTEIFFGGEITANEVAMAVQTLPFLSQKRIVIVKNANKIKSAELEKLKRCVPIIPPSSCLIIVWPEKIRPENTKSSFFETVNENGIIIEFKRVYDRELPAWIQKEVRNRAKTISVDALEYLIEESGSNLMDLTNEIEKLDLFTGINKKITLQDVEILSGHTKIANLNNLAQAVESKKLKSAIDVTEKLLNEEEVPLRILSTIYRIIRRLLFAKSLAEDKKSSQQEIQRELRLHIYFDKKFFSNLSLFTTIELQKDIELIMQADLELKTSNRDESLVFEELLLALCGSRNR